MRIALAQLNFTVGAFDANFARMREAVADARADRADLVVFSELAATGYPPRDLRSVWVRGRELELVDRVASCRTIDWASSWGLSSQSGNRRQGVYNAAALCHQGSVIERRHKCLLPTMTCSTKTATSSRPAVWLHGVPWRRLGVTFARTCGTIPKCGRAAVPS